MTLDDLYAQVPAISCKGLCHTSCGPLVIGESERQRIQERHGVDIPDLQWTCPALNAFGRCSVYEDRPMICRLWGVDQAMPCVYGCLPDRILPTAEGQRLLALAVGPRALVDKVVPVFHPPGHVGGVS